METTHTKEENGLKVTVTIDQGSMKKTAYADGWNVNLGKKTYDFTSVKIEKGGKSAFVGDLNFFYIVDRTAGRNDELPAEAFARFGDSYISEPVYNTIKAAINEAREIADSETNEEYETVKSAEDRKKTAKDKARKDYEKKEAADIQRKVNSGFCFNCETWCHGDCGNYRKDPVYKFRRNLSEAIREQNYGINDNA